MCVCVFFSFASLQNIALFVSKCCLASFNVTLDFRACVSLFRLGFAGTINDIRVRDPINTHLVLDTN